MCFDGKMREALEELVELVKDHMEGNYRFDSFSLQPAEAALTQQPTPPAPAGWGRNNAQLLLMDQIIEELEGGFVACSTCGDQQDTATLDCMSDLRQLRNLLLSAAPSPAAEETLSQSDREWLEGMEVSVDVSTGEHDASHRLFGTVCEVMDHPGGKHGVIMLVADAESNGDKSTTTTPQVPDLTPEMVKAIQTKTAIGGYICNEWSGAYGSLPELWRVANSAAPSIAEKPEPRQGDDSGERCTKCGEKDWFAGPSCQPPATGDK